MSAKLTLALSVLVSAANAQQVIYVDDDAPPGGDGTSWPTAFMYLQDALAVAAGGDEIRVAQGMYKPDRDEAGIVTRGDREATFQLVNLIRLHGGYAGIRAPDPDERGIRVYETILSGDLDGDDIPNLIAFITCFSGEDEPYDDPECAEYDFDNDGDIDSEEGKIDDNSLHVVTGSGTDKSTFLEGFTITKGNADILNTHYVGAGLVSSRGGPTVSRCTFKTNNTLIGGAVYSYNPDNAASTFDNCVFVENAGAFAGAMMTYLSSPMLVDCLFIRNVGRSFGGGIEAFFSNPTLINCTFRDNRAKAGGAMITWSSSPTLIGCTFDRNFASLGGGAIYIDDGADLTLTNCVFTRNTSKDGGAMYNQWGAPTLAHCVFSGNQADEDGGAIFNFTCNPMLTNCLFAGNIAGDKGGAIYTTLQSNGLEAIRPTLSIAGCTFLGNAAPNGPTAAFRSFNSLYPNDVQITDSILWNGADAFWQTDDTLITITHSDVQGGWPGHGNINAHPLFVPGPAGCYYLSQMAAGQDVDSPCINAGSDTAVDHGLGTLTTRSDEIFDAGTVDMGYHYPATVQPLIMGDFNRDTRVDLADVAEFQKCFSGEGPTDVPPCCRIFDYNQPDDDVDLDDYEAFRSALGGPMLGKLGPSCKACR